MTDALDMTVDTFHCGLLHGEVDTSGYPEYNAIVGGLATHWDELSGELIVRAVIGWGGKGLRGDTERIGAKLLSSLYQQVLASGFSLGEAESARLPSIGGRSAWSARTAASRPAAPAPSTARSAACAWRAGRSRSSTFGVGRGPPESHCSLPGPEHEDGDVRHRTPPDPP